MAHAFVWAYTDEDQDGEPDWDNEILAGTATLTEAFGETDQNGYFSFYLEEAGKYSLRIDIPGQMSSLAPAPIGFTLKNPNDSVKLGNAVKIDWKAELKASAFDVQRKSSTSSTYVSLFAGEDNASKPSANAKSYVDATAKPGASYSYRVVAETANGQVNLNADQVRTSSPSFILLQPAKRSMDGFWTHPVIQLQMLKSLPGVKKGRGGVLLFPVTTDPTNSRLGRVSGKLRFTDLSTSRSTGYTNPLPSA